MLATVMEGLVWKEEDTSEGHEKVLDERFT